MSMVVLRSKVSYRAPSDGAVNGLLAVHETGPPVPPKPRLLDRVREAIRARHYSRRTEKSYVAWVRRYILFHGKRHPAEMGPREITQFLSALAVRDKVAALTQNQALSALLFLYRVVLEREVPWLAATQVCPFVVMPSRGHAGAQDLFPTETMRNESDPRRR